MAGPNAVGAIPPRAGYGDAPEGTDTIVNLLQRIADSLKALEVRLAPSPQFIPIQFKAVPAGIVLTPVSIPTGGFNGVLVGITAGVVNMYFGTGVTAVPDLQFTGTQNPIYVPLPPRSEHQILFGVDSASPAAATGVIYLVQY